MSQKRTTQAQTTMSNRTGITSSTFFEPEYLDCVLSSNKRFGSNGRCKYPRFYIEDIEFILEKRLYVPYMLLNMRNARETSNLQYV